MADPLPTDVMEVLEARQQTHAPETDGFSAEDLSGFPAREEFVPEPAADPDPVDQLREIEERETEPAYMEQVEDFADNIEAGAMSEEDIEGFGDLVVGLVEQSKSYINRYFKASYKKRIEAEFPGEKKKLLNLVIFLDQAGEMTSSSIDNMEMWAEKYKVELPEMISAYVAYVEIREELRASSFHQWQQDGIRKHTERALRKYMNKGLDPLLMLGLYIATAMGVDLFKLFKNKSKIGE